MDGDGPAHWSDRGAVPWWIGRDFAALWAGQCLSNLGDALFSTTLLFVVVTKIAAGQPWAPLAVSGLLAIEIAPTLVLRPFAGVWVDRWSSRGTLLWVDGLRAAAIALYWSASVLASAATWQTGLGMVYGVVLLVSVGAQFFNPAQMALLAEIVPPAQRGRASGLSVMTSELALVLGPALAGPLYFLVGMRWALALNLGSYLISCLTIWLIASAVRGMPSDAPAPRFWPEFRAGMRLFVAHRVLRAIAIALALAMFGIGILQSLNVFFVTRNLGAPVGWFGYLGATFSVGSILGGAAGTLWAGRWGLARTFSGAMCAVGLLIVAYAWTDRFWLALCLYGLLGIPNALNNVALSPLVLNATPPGYVGRIFALLMPAWSSVYLLSLLLSGVLYSRIPANAGVALGGLTIQPLTLMFSGTGVVVFAGGIYALFALRGAES